MSGEIVGDYVMLVIYVFYLCLTEAAHNPKNVMAPLSISIS